MSWKPRWLVAGGIGGLIAVGGIGVLALRQASPPAVAKPALHFEQFPISTGGMFGVTVDHVGNVWWVDVGGRPIRIGRMTPSGQATEFPVPTTARSSWGLVQDPAGGLVFTQYNNGGGYGHVDAAGHIVELAVPWRGDNQTTGIAFDRAGHLWIAPKAGGYVFRVGNDRVDPFVLPPANQNPGPMILDPDGNVWLVDSGEGRRILRITPDGTINALPVAGTFTGTAGPDRAVWFVDEFNEILRVTVDGKLTQFPMPRTRAGLSSITAGRDGNLWFTEGWANRIGRITPAGKITEWPLPTALTQPASIVADPRGPIWFTAHTFHSDSRGIQSSVDTWLVRFAVPSS